jgi:hypothetical protein
LYRFITGQDCTNQPFYVLATTTYLLPGKQISIDIPKTRIKKVYCNDLKNAFGEPKERLQVIIQQNAYTQTAFRLKNYDDGGELIDTFGALEGVTLAGYDKEMVGDHQEDE